jgi:cytoskeletal protein RodZ
MRQKLDITDVEARTKIRAKYLRALENEEWGLLPGSTFVKTFLRTYAEALGLDAHLLVEEYRVHHEAPDELELQPLAPGGRDGGRARRRGPGPPGPGAMLAVVVVAVLAFLIVLGLSGEDGEEGDQSANRPTRTTERKPRRPARREPRPAPRQVSVRVAPQGPTYVCVDSGPGTERTFEGTITEPRAFKGKRVRLNLGRRAVDLRANGKRVAIEPGPAPIGFDLTPKKSTELAEGQRPCA